MKGDSRYNIICLLNRASPLYPSRPHTCSKITTVGPRHWPGTAFSSPWPVTGIFTTCRDTHPYPAQPPPLHCHTDNILDQQAGVCESSQFPSSLHIYIFPSKFAVPSTTKSFCGPTWLALASEMWTEMAVDKFWAYTKGQHIFCSLLLLRILPRHSSGSRRMKHTWNRATLASQQTWKNGNVCLLLAIGVWAALLHGIAR